MKIIKVESLMHGSIYIIEKNIDESELGFECFSLKEPEYIFKLEDWGINMDYFKELKTIIDVIWEGNINICLSENGEFFLSSSAGIITNSISLLNKIGVDVGNENY